MRRNGVRREAEAVSCGKWLLQRLGVITITCQVLQTEVSLEGENQQCGPGQTQGGPPTGRKGPKFVWGGGYVIDHQAGVGQGWDLLPCSHFSLLMCVWSPWLHIGRRLSFGAGRGGESCSGSNPVRHQLVSLCWRLENFVFKSLATITVFRASFSSDGAQCKRDIC